MAPAGRISRLGTSILKKVREALNVLQKRDQPKFVLVTFFEGEVALSGEKHPLLPTNISNISELKR